MRVQLLLGRALRILATGIALAACGDAVSDAEDARAVRDAGPGDFGFLDLGFRPPRDAATDSGASDLGPAEMSDGGPDAGAEDSGSGARPDRDDDVGPDATSLDGGSEADAGLGGADAGSVDVPDAGYSDASVLDSGSYDAGPLPSGPEIAFSSKRGRVDYDVFTMALDGSGVAPLASSPGIDFFPSWVPDRSALVFASDRSGTLGIHRFDRATGAVVPLVVDLGLSNAPAVSPDGSELVFEGRALLADRSQIYRVAIDGTARVQLTTGTGRSAGPAWSPSGQQIYFVSDRGGPFEVYRMNRDGTNVVRLTTGSRVLGRPAVSPDGLKIAYARLSSDGERSEIVAYDRLDRSTVVLTGQNDSEPFYGPDGRYLLFTTLRHGNPEVMRLELGTSTPAVRLTRDPAIDGAAVLSP